MSTERRKTVRLKVWPEQLRTGDLVFVDGRYRPWWGNYPVAKYSDAKIVMTAEGEPPDRDFRSATFEDDTVFVRRVVVANHCPHCGLSVAD